MDFLKILFIFIIFFFFHTFSSSTALGDLAASMSAGEWAELSTSNINPTLSNTGGASNTVFGYTEDIKWDPSDQELIYAGSDHFYSDGGYPRFVKYSASTNSWRELTRPSWFGFHRSGAMHGYDHNAVNPANGDFFHAPFGRNSIVHKYAAGTSQWSVLPQYPSSSCSGGLEYVPELNGLLYAEAGKLMYLPDGAAQWQTLASGLTMGGCHGFLEHNPVHQVTLFGGGESGAVGGYPNIYKMDMDKNVTTMKNAPVGLGPNQAIQTVDPVSGDYLVFTMSGRFYVYDILTDSWSQKSNSNVPIFVSREKQVHGVVATPVSTYGVTLFVRCDRGDCSVWLYKHSAGSVTPRDRLFLQSDRIRLCVSLNPFSERAVITLLNGPGQVKLSLFDLRGRLVKHFQMDKNNRLTLRGIDLENGAYIFKACTGNRQFSQKILFLK